MGDGTMMGVYCRCKHTNGCGERSGIGRFFQIERGGNTRNGCKEHDVATADCLTVTKERKATMEARIVVGGCRRSGIYWL